MEERQEQERQPKEQDDGERQEQDEDLVGIDRLEARPMAFIRNKELPGLRTFLAGYVEHPTLCKEPAWHDLLLMLATHVARKGDREFAMYFVEELRIPIQPPIVCNPTAATQGLTENPTPFPSTPLWAARRPGHGNAQAASSREIGLGTTI